jgi:hypothetical protein
LYEQQPFLPIRPASKAEQMRECLRSLKQAHKVPVNPSSPLFAVVATFNMFVVFSPHFEFKFSSVQQEKALSVFLVLPHLETKSLL